MRARPGTAKSIIRRYVVTSSHRVAVYMDFSPSLCFVYWHVICFQMQLYSYAPRQVVLRARSLPALCAVPLKRLSSDALYCVRIVYEDAGFQVAGATKCVIRRRSYDDRSSKEPEWPPVST